MPLEQCFVAGGSHRRVDGGRHPQSLLDRPVGITARSRWLVRWARVRVRAKVRVRVRAKAKVRAGVRVWCWV